jgi:hypothetical protein
MKPCRLTSNFSLDKVVLQFFHCKRQIVLCHQQHAKLRPKKNASDNKKIHQAHPFVGFD